MRTLSRDLYIETIHRGHHRTRAHCEPTDIESWPIVHAENGIDGEALEQSVFDHDFRTARRFLGRLEDKLNRSFEAPVLGQVTCRTEQHRRVPIVSTRVHLAVVLRSMIERVRLMDRQRIHVGSQPDPSARAALERTDNTGRG